MGFKRTSFLTVFTAILLLFIGCKKEEVIYSDLKVEPTQLNLKQNKTIVISIVSGSGEYSVSSNDQNIATAELTESNAVTVKGISEGTTKITIRDIKSGQTKKVVVTVKKPSPNLSISESKLNIEQNKTAEISVISGSGEYSVSSNDQNIATVELTKSSTITIKAISEGVAEITVKDVKSEQTKDVIITVKKSVPNLSISESKLSIEQNKTAEISVISGSGEYSVSSSDQNIAMVTLTGSSISIKAISEGTAKIIIRDIKSGQTKSIAITVKKATQSNAKLYISRSHNGKFDSKPGSKGELNAVMNYKDGKLHITSVTIKYRISRFWGELTRRAEVKWEGEGSIGQFSWVGQLLNKEGKAILLKGKPVYCSYQVGVIRDPGKGYGFDVTTSPDWDKAFVYFDKNNLTTSFGISAKEAKNLYEKDFVLGNLTLLKVNNKKVR